VGTVEGDLESGGRVRIEKGGRVRGNIAASAVIVNGALEGHIQAAEHVELGPESRMAGNIKAAKIAIAEGCFFQGDIKMSAGDDRPVSSWRKGPPNSRRLENDLVIARRFLLLPAASIGQLGPWLSSLVLPQPRRHGI